MLRVPQYFRRALYGLAMLIVVMGGVVHSDPAQSESDNVTGDQASEGFVGRPHSEGPTSNGQPQRQQVDGYGLVSVSYAPRDGSYTCGITLSGTIDCWGARGNDIVDEIGSSIGGVFGSIALGTTFACGIRRDTRLSCWDLPLDYSDSQEFCTIGLDARETCGGSGISDDVPTGSFIAVDAVGDRFCALRVSGRLECWGAYPSSELSNTWPFEQWVDELSARHLFTTVDVGFNSICGVDLGGELACTPNYDAYAVGLDEEDWMPPEGLFVDVSIGHAHGCGIRVDRTVACWGADWFGQASPPDGQFEEIHASGMFTCGLRVTGHLDCWGQEYEGPCGPSDFGVLVNLDYIGNWAWYPSVCAGWRQGYTVLGPFESIDIRKVHPVLYPEQGPVRYARACGVIVGGAPICWNDPVSSVPARPPVGEFKAVAVSGERRCALAITGGVKCWGPGTAGWVVPDGPFVELSMESAHACGLRASGGISCWGDDRHGETDAPSGAFKSLAAGNELSCGLRPSGELGCWGDEEWLAAMPPPGPFKSVTVGSQAACAQRPGGTLECWGNWRRGQGPEGTLASLRMDGQFCGLGPKGEVECPTAPQGSSWAYVGRPYGDSEMVVENSPGGRFSDFDGAGSTACGLRFDSTVECWDADGAWSSEALAGAFVAIAAHTAHMCGIRIDSTLECWGPHDPPGGWGLPKPGSVSVDILRPSRQRLGPTDDPSPGAPSSLDFVQRGRQPGRYIAIGSGESHTCGVRIDGDVHCWGESHFTMGGPSFVSVTVGGQGYCERDYLHVANREGCPVWVCAIDAESRPSCRSAVDSLAASGDGTRSMPMPLLGRVKAFDVGFDACAVIPNGGVSCGHDTGWGAQSYLIDGQIPYVLDSLGRADVPTTGDFTDIAVGYGKDLAKYEEYKTLDYLERYQKRVSQHACAIESGGDLLCWGGNAYGQSLAPPAWLEWAPYGDVAAGYGFTCALDRRSEARCWGDNTHGQTDAPGGGFTSLTAGMWHVCGLRVNGNVECWGDGPGPGGTLEQFDAPPEGAPTEPPAGQFSQVSAGQWHTCGLRPGGTVDCWYNY